MSHRALTHAPAGVATSGDVQSDEAEGKEGETAGLGQKLRTRICGKLRAGELPGSATARAAATGSTSTEAAATAGAAATGATSTEAATGATAAGATATG